MGYSQYPATDCYSGNFSICYLFTQYLWKPPVWFKGDFRGDVRVWFWYFAPHSVWLNLKMGKTRAKTENWYAPPIVHMRQS